MKHLATAFEENRNQRIDFLRIFDNSENFGSPRLVLSMFRGVPRGSPRMFRRGSKPLSKRQISPLQTCVVPCGAGDWAAESLQQTCRKPRDLLTVSDAAGLGGGGSPEPRP